MGIGGSRSYLADIENLVKTISDAVGIVTTRITNVDQIPGGLLKNSKKVKEDASESLGNERGDPLLTVLWRKPPKMVFKNSFLVTDRSLTADGGLL